MNNLFEYLQKFSIKKVTKKNQKLNSISVALKEGRGLNVYKSKYFWQGKESVSRTFHDRSALEAGHSYVLKSKKLFGIGKVVCRPFLESREVWGI